VIKSGSRSQSSMKTSSYFFLIQSCLVVLTEGNVLNKFKVDKDEIINEIVYEDSVLFCLTSNKNTSEILIRFFNFNTNVFKRFLTL
jgi:hypothetical protein